MNWEKLPSCESQNRIHQLRDYLNINFPQLEGIFVFSKHCNMAWSNCFPVRRLHDEQTMHIWKHNWDTGRACRQPQLIRLIINKQKMDCGLCPRSCIHSKHTLCYNPLHLTGSSFDLYNTMRIERTDFHFKKFCCGLIHNSSFNVGSLT